MKTRVGCLSLILLALLPSAACRRTAARDWNAALQPLRMKYAPDPRLAVFHVTVRQERARLVVEGEVESAAARSEVLERIASLSGAPATDRLAVLPDPQLGTARLGIVNASVGNLRRSPEHSAEMVTQVLLGATLRLLRRDGGWYYVQCPDRYLGWIDDDAVVPVDAQGAQAWASSALSIFTPASGALASGPDPSSAPVCDLTAGDLLQTAGRSGSWIETALPDGRRGFVPASAVEPYSAWKASRKPTPETVERTARSYLGIPYLWGGTSAKGFDCSGFVKTVYGMNGIDVLRDADQQAGQGRDAPAGIRFGGLQRGDLLFFGRAADEGKPERIWHVGISLGGGEFIHCSGRVRIASLDPQSPDFDRHRAETFVRARRLLGTERP